MPCAIPGACVHYASDVSAKLDCCLRILRHGPHRREFVREVEPGELITIDEQGMHSEILVRIPRQSLCVFEYIYFSDATSQLNGRYVYTVREALGRELAREHPVEADMVIPVPDSSIPAALGYAAASGIPYGQAIIKNRYSDRTFIKPDQRLRQLEVDLKFNMVKPKIAGQAPGDCG